MSQLAKRIAARYLKIVAAGDIEERKKKIIQGIKDAKGKPGAEFFIEQRLADYHNWARGEQDELRKEKYPDWQDTDFMDILEAVGEQTTRQTTLPWD